MTRLILMALGVCGSLPLSGLLIMFYAGVAIVRHYAEFSRGNEEGSGVSR